MTELLPKIEFPNTSILRRFLDLPDLDTILGDVHNIDYLGSFYDGNNNQVDVFDLEINVSGLRSSEQIKISAIRLRELFRNANGLNRRLILKIVLASYPIMPTIPHMNIIQETQELAKLGKHVQIFYTSNHLVKVLAGIQSATNPYTYIVASKEELELKASELVAAKLTQLI